MMLRWLWLTSLCLLDAAGLDELYDLYSCIQFGAIEE